MNTLSNPSALLEKPVWQMTGEEFMQLAQIAISRDSSCGEEPIRYAYGVNELCAHIGCCQSTIYELKKKGVLDEAVVSRVGRRIVFDVERARALADTYQREQRSKRI